MASSAAQTRTPRVGAPVVIARRDAPPPGRLAVAGRPPARSSPLPGRSLPPGARTKARHEADICLSIGAHDEAEGEDTAKRFVPQICSIRLYTLRPLTSVLSPKTLTTLAALREARNG